MLALTLSASAVGELLAFVAAELGVAKLLGPTPSPEALAARILAADARVAVVERLVLRCSLDLLTWDPWADVAEPVTVLRERYGVA